VSAASRLLQRRVARLRGFTLIELMVVVVLIAILAAIAVPAVVQRLRARRASEAAERIATLYRGARVRALGRGAAVLVRFEDEKFTVYENIIGATAATSETGNASCAQMPSASCLRANWANTGADTRRVVGGFQVTGRPEYTDANVAISVLDTAGSATTTLDVCFSPIGQAYTRTNLTGTLAPLNGVVGATVTRTGITGIIHRVTVIPNGVAAVTAGS
jgi:prepilin-type N-terminal cleavage/methylation domain-containing protein